MSLQVSTEIKILTYLFRNNIQLFYITYKENNTCSSITIIIKKGFSGLIGRIKGTKSKKQPTSERRRSSVELISSKQLGNENNLINNAKSTIEKQQQKNPDTNCKQASQTQLILSQTKIDPINNRISSSIRANKESMNECDYHKNTEPTARNGDTDPLDCRNETSNIKALQSNNNKREQTKSIPSKSNFSEPVDTVYKFPEPSDNNISSPIDGILSSDQIPQFFDPPTNSNYKQKADTASKAKVPQKSKLLNAAEVSNRPRDSLLFTRRQKYKKMDKGLETINRLILSVVGQSRGNCVIKSTPITDDYTIGSNVLGLGINGKVVECVRKVKPNDNSANQSKKCALKVLKDNAKSRREIDLHWKASNCKHIVNIMDVYENTYSGNKCLLVVMEW